MVSFGGLYIPRKATDAVPRGVCEVTSLQQIQKRVFCTRSSLSECGGITCYKCLFTKDNLPIFVKWYRGKKLMYRRERLNNKQLVNI